MWEHRRKVTKKDYLKCLDRKGILSLKLATGYTDIYKTAAVTIMFMPRAWVFRDLVALGYCFEIVILCFYECYVYCKTKGSKKFRIITSV